MGQNGKQKASRYKKGSKWRKPVALVKWSKRVALVKMAQNSKKGVAFVKTKVRNVYFGPMLSLTPFGTYRIW